MNKLLLLIILVVALGAGYFAYDSYKGELVMDDDESAMHDDDMDDADEMNDADQMKDGEMNDDEEASGDTGAKASGVTTTELAKHNSESDCWINYNGRVFDVTTFLPVHPGGVDKIAEFCGKASGFDAAFKAQHGTSKVEDLETKAGKLQGELEG